MTPFIEPIDWDWNDDQDQVDAYDKIVRQYNPMI